MKKVLSLLTFVLLAMPAYAQDELVLTGGDIDALLGGGNRNNNRGGRGNNNQLQIPDPVFFYEDVKALLKDKKVPLDKNQEKALQTFLTAETTKMRTDLEAQFQGRGNRGNANQQNDLTRIRDLSAAVEKHNAALLTETKAALLPDQASLVDKAAKDKKVCSVLIDMINFDQLRQRFNNQNQNNNFRGGGGPGGFEGGGLDLSAFGLDFPQGGGGGNRGGNNNNFQNQISSIIPTRPSCTSKDSTPAQRVAVLGEILTKGKKPLTADQETKVAALVEGKVKTMMDELKATDPQIEQFVNNLANQARNAANNNNNQNNQNQQQTQTPQVNVQTLTNNIVNTIMSNLGIQTNNNNNNNQNNRGGRGGNQNQQNNQNQPNNQNNQNPANNNNNFNRGNNNNNNGFNPQAEIQKKNEELYDKVAALLKPEQGAFVKKVKYDQIKARGPVDKYRGILEEEGTPLTPEQVTQIQQLLNAASQATRTFAQGLVTTEINALEPGALQAAAQQIIQQQQQQQQQQQNPQQNRNNTNVNNVGQNGVAQQIVSKVIGQVSTQHSRLDKIANDQVMTRVLTPAQQASYKVHSLTK
jgi:hypothetical protein